MENIQLKQLWLDYAKSYFLFTPSFQKNLLCGVGEQLYGRVFDAGCGVGKLIPNILSYEQYVGIDFNEAMIEVAKKNYVESSNLSFNLGDVSKIQYDDNYFDSCASINVLYSLESPISFINEVNRILKPNGRFVLASPNLNLDMGFLEKKLIEEFANIENKNLQVEFENYLAINRKLASGVENYSPKLFSENEIESILIDAGFKVLKKDGGYFGQLFNFTLEKL